MMNILQNLPKKYQSLGTVPVVSLKFGLIERVDAILALLESSKHIQFDSPTLALLKRFFTYLDASCLDFKQLHKRAKWILKYAECVYTHLLYVKHGRSLSSQIARYNDSDGFGNKIHIFTTTLCSYCVMVNGSAPWLEINQYGLNTFIEYRNAVREDLQDPDYCEISEKLEMLTNVLRRAIRTRTQFEDRDFIYRQIIILTKAMYVHVYKKQLQI